MTDFTPTVVQPPTWLTQVLTPVLRHLSTVAAGSLLTWGAINPDQSAQLQAILASVLMFGATLAWSWVEKKFHADNADARVAQAKAGL